MTWFDLIKDYFTRFEPFEAAPYWDYKQWSWGYGTRVPGSVDDPGVKPGGTITRAKALQSAYSHIENDYEVLRKLVKVPLTGKQWAALLSFSYNLGTGNADNLVANINAKDWEALKAQWLLYNKAGGAYKQFLADRREYEISKFIEDV